ncbi:MAG: hypothetical protein ACXWDL_13450 [Nocardioides sp.]
MSNELIDLTRVVVLRRELLADGHTDTSIRALRRQGVLHRVRHGCYVDAPLWHSLGAADRHRVLVRAVLRTAHPSAVVSHISAAVEQGAAVWGVDLETAHLTRRDGRCGRREAGVAQHRGKLHDDDVITVNDLPVTRPARCALEVLSTTRAEPALVTINSLLHQGSLTRAELHAVNRDLKHWPSTLAAPVVLRLCNERIESVGESRTSYLCYLQHLPRPEPQVEVRDERGVLVGRVDFAWPGAGVFLEFQGKEKYRRYRRKGESLEDYLLREKRRIELICQLTGWVCIAITWADLARPEQTAARIRKVLSSRRGADV